MNFKALVSEQYRELEPYKAGLTTEKIKQKYQIENVFKYTSNESAFAPSPRVIAAVEQAVVNANRYPDYDRLKCRIADAFCLESTNILLGTGSIDVLDILFQTFSRTDHNVVFSSHSYFAYPLLAEKSGLTIKVAPCDKGFGHDAEALVSLCDDKTSGASFK